MTASDLAKPEDRKMISDLYKLITEFEPALQELIQAGFPFDEHWKQLQERKLWNRKMAEVFRVDLQTGNLSKTSPESTYATPTA